MRLFEQDMELNRVVMPNKNEKQKEFDLSSADDRLWRDFKGSPFPLVAEAIQDSLDTYRKNEDEIKRLKETMVSQSSEPSFAKWQLFVFSGNSKSGGGGNNVRNGRRDRQTDVGDRQPAGAAGAEATNRLAHQHCHLVAGEHQGA